MLSISDPVILLQPDSLINFESMQVFFPKNFNLLFEAIRETSTSTISFWTFGNLFNNYFISPVSSDKNNTVTLFVLAGFSFKPLTNAANLFPAVVLVSFPTGIEYFTITTILNISGSLVFSIFRSAINVFAWYSRLTFSIHCRSSIGAFRVACIANF